MDGATVTRVIGRIKVETRYTVINEESETTPIVRGTSSSPTCGKRCGNATLILISYTIGIGSIILGASYINDCPDQKMFPIGLIIFGAVLVVQRLLNCVYDCRNVSDEEDAEDTPQGLKILNVIFFIASFGMFVAVCCWANSMNPTTKPEDRGLKNYCDPTFAKYAVWIIILGMLPVLYGCCPGVCFSICCE